MKILQWRSRSPTLTLHGFSTWALFTFYIIILTQLSSIKFIGFVTQRAETGDWKCQAKPEK